MIRNDAYGQILAVSKEYDKGVKNVGVHFKNYAEYKEANEEEFNESPPMRDPTTGRTDKLHILS